MDRVRKCMKFNVGIIILDIGKKGWVNISGKAEGGHLVRNFG